MGTYNKLGKRKRTFPTKDLRRQFAVLNEGTYTEKLYELKGNTRLCIFTDEETIDKTLNYSVDKSCRKLIPLKQREMAESLAKQATEGELELLKMLEEKGSKDPFIPKTYEAEDMEVSIKKALFEVNLEAQKRRNPVEVGNGDS